MWNQNEPHQNNSKPFKKIHLKDTCSNKYNNPQQPNNTSPEQQQLFQENNKPTKWLPTT